LEGEIGKALAKFTVIAVQVGYYSWLNVTVMTEECGMSSSLLHPMLIT